MNKPATENKVFPPGMVYGIIEKLIVWQEQNVVSYSQLNSANRKYNYNTISSSQQFRKNIENKHWKRGLLRQNLTVKRRIGKQKLMARTSKYKLMSGDVKYKLGLRVRKHKYHLLCRF